MSASGCLARASWAEARAPMRAPLCARRRGPVSPSNPEQQWPRRRAPAAAGAVLRVRGAAALRDLLAGKGRRAAAQLLLRCGEVQGRGPSRTWARRRCPAGGDIWGNWGNERTPCRGCRCLPHALSIRRGSGGFPKHPGRLPFNRWQNWGP